MIAITGSFSRAAALLGYQQSSVTYQIKALEKVLGAALFERERFSRRISITEYGRQVLHYSGLMLKLADDLLSKKARNAADDHFSASGQREKMRRD
jgi:DNA-binding transcriptional LysR family regulator